MHGARAFHGWLVLAPMKPEGENIALFVRANCLIPLSEPVPFVAGNTVFVERFPSHETACSMASG